MRISRHTHSECYTDISKRSTGRDEKSLSCLKNSMHSILFFAGHHEDGVEEERETQTHRHSRRR